MLLSNAGTLAAAHSRPRLPRVISRTGVFANFVISPTAVVLGRPPPKGDVRVAGTPVAPSRRHEGGAA